MNVGSMTQVSRVLISFLSDKNMLDTLFPNRNANGLRASIVKIVIGRDKHACDK